MAASDITCSGLATTSDTQGVKLSWAYSDPRSGALPNIALDAVEVWVATTNDRAGAAKVGEGIVDFLHAGLGRGAVRYYWVKARDKIGGYGPWYPSGATSGVSGTEATTNVLLATNGYWELPSGLIFEWGVSQTSAGIGVAFTQRITNTGSIYTWVGVVQDTPTTEAFVVHDSGHASTGGNLSVVFTVTRANNGGAVAVAGTKFVGWFCIGKNA